MTERKPESKKIPRPKVSFSQSDQKEQEIAKQCKQKLTRQSQFRNAPKIRSIVPFHKSVKILKPEKTASTCNKTVSSNECRIDSSTHTSDIASENVQSISQVIKDMPKTSEVSCHASGVQNVKEKQNVLQLGNTLASIMKNYTDLQQKGKEGEKDMFKKKKQPSVSRIGNRTTKTDTFNVKSTTSSLSFSHTPHYKTAAKNKFPIKSSLCNINDKSDLHIKKHLSCVISPSGQNYDTKKFKLSSVPYHIEQTIGHPKYNSIICLTDKLKKLEQQKIITDINHLPFSQKNLINEKVSAALDFRLDEAIYKNLIDLTIDEEILPHIIKRSKDPKPRQKDITPKLSDFFIPEDIKEYCEDVHVKLRPPKIDESWNAFKISAKIFEWRDNLDDMNRIA